MSDFSISISNGNVEVVLNENLEETDIKQMLTFVPENVENLLCEHAAIQAYWEALCIRLKQHYLDFNEKQARKWWAHSNSYARMILAAYGDPKPSGGAVQDMVVQIYSADNSDNERQKFAVIAFNYVVKKSLFTGTYDEYFVQMYKYLLLDTGAWYFESIVSQEHFLEENFEIVKKVAERLNSQAFHLDTYAKMSMAKKGNIGPQTISDGEIMGRIGGDKK